MFGKFSRHFAQVRKMRFLPFSPLTPMQSVLLLSNQSPDSPFQVHHKPLKVTKIATFQVVILSFPSYLRIGNIKNSTFSKRPRFVHCTMSLESPFEKLLITPEDPVPLEEIGNCAKLELFYYRSDMFIHVLKVKIFGPFV